MAIIYFYFMIAFCTMVLLKRGRPVTYALAFLCALVWPLLLIIYFVLMCHRALTLTR